jgi:Spy/CpxP family protein refolding chaperone
MKTARWIGVKGVALWTVATLGLVGATGLAAAEGRRARGEARASRGDSIADYLGLTEEQRASWRALRDEQREQMKPLRSEGRELQRRLRETIEVQPADAAAVGQATLAVKTHRQRVQAQREAFEQQLRSLLSPEQQQKLGAMKAARRALEQGRERRGKRPGARERRREGPGAPSGAPPVQG